MDEANGLKCDLSVSLGKEHMAIPCTSFANFL